MPKKKVAATKPDSRAPKKAAKASPQQKDVPEKPASDSKPSRVKKLQAILDRKQPVQAEIQARVAKAAPKRPAKPKAEPEKAVDQDAETPDDGDLCGLSVRAALVIDHYLLHFNASRAYVEAGYTAKSPQVAHAASSRLLASVKGRAYLAKRSKAIFDRMSEEQDRLVQSYTFTAFADPRELTEHHRGACRYCYGKFHRYQFTMGEWDAKITAHAEKQEKAAESGGPMPKDPDAKGGTGYDWRREPHEDCPECFGLGVGRTILKDTRNLSPAALALYAGVKEGKDGIEIKMHDQMKARDVLAKYRKLYEDSTEVNLNFDPAALEQRYAKKMADSAARAEAVRKERFGEGGEPAAS